MSFPLDRRQFLAAAGSFAAASWLGAPGDRSRLAAQEPGERPPRDPQVRVLNPRGRVPVSMIIDDSTCLVNLAHFCIPQFAEVFPKRYLQDWRKLPREIPDSFVEKFAGWCHEHGVRGKYSVIPYPACVGWLDRDLPGWTWKELETSLDLVRRQVMPDWDIHPEMVSHTWVVDTRTGRPYPERSERFMENWGWSVNRSVDELANYLSYALRILKNVGLPCEGVTTPGGFGSRARPQLAQAALESCRDVFAAEIPHYFRDLYTDDRSVAPRVEYASGLAGEHPRCVVSIVGCTGDWFGGWDGLEEGTVDQFITADLRGGRLPQVIDRGEPAVLVCHWPGIYFNGEERGFKIFQEVVRRLHARYDHLLWMKLSEIARYWAAKELTELKRDVGGLTLRAPYAAPAFTLELPAAGLARPSLAHAAGRVEFRPVEDRRQLAAGTCLRTGDRLTLCFDLPRGASRIENAA